MNFHFSEHALERLQERSTMSESAVLAMLDNGICKEITGGGKEHVSGFLVWDASSAQCYCAVACVITGTIITFLDAAPGVVLRGLINGEVVWVKRVGAEEISTARVLAIGKKYNFMAAFTNQNQKRQTVKLGVVQMKADQCDVPPDQIMEALADVVSKGMLVDTVWAQSKKKGIVAKVWSV